MINCGKAGVGQDFFVSTRDFRLSFESIDEAASMRVSTKQNCSMTGYIFRSVDMNPDPVLLLIYRPDVAVRNCRQRTCYKRSVE